MLLLLLLSSSCWLLLLLLLLLFLTLIGAFSTAGGNTRSGEMLDGRIGAAGVVRTGSFNSEQLQLKTAMTTRDGTDRVLSLMKELVAAVEVLGGVAHRMAEVRMMLMMLLVLLPVLLCALLRQLLRLLALTSVSCMAEAAARDSADTAALSAVRMSLVLLLVLLRLLVLTSLLQSVRHTLCPALLRVLSWGFKVRFFRFLFACLLACFSLACS